MNGLYKQYSHYEKDSTLDHETLSKYVKEWYDKTSECFKEEHMNKKILLEAIHDSGVALRNNFK